MITLYWKHCQGIRIISTFRKSLKREINLEIKWLSVLDLAKLDLRSLCISDTVLFRKFQKDSIVLSKKQSAKCDCISSKFVFQKVLLFTKKQNKFAKID